MTKRLLPLCLSAWLCIVAGCASHPSATHATADISLEQAKRLITSGRVKEIFQPHQGCVLLTLKDGRLLTFDQPHLDWVLSFVEQNGLSDDIPVSLE